MVVCDPGARHLEHYLLVGSPSWGRDTRELQVSHGQAHQSSISMPPRVLLLTSTVQYNSRYPGVVI